MWKKQCAVRTCWAQNVWIWFSVRRFKVEGLIIILVDDSNVFIMILTTVKLLKESLQNEGEY